jgi:hypothetical protein
VHPGDETMNDPLEQILQHAAPGQNSEAALRARVYEQTVRTLRRRRRVRKLVVAGCLGVCFAAGMAVMALGRHVFPDDREPKPVVAMVPQPRAWAKPGPVFPAATAKIAPSTPSTPSALSREWQAFDTKKPQFFLQAGNSYLLERQDISSALRCYRQAFANATDEELADSPDDNWLVVALKQTRRKELADARNR